MISKSHLHATLCPVCNDGDSRRNSNFIKTVNIVAGDSYAQSFLMERINKKVDELWDTVNKENSALMFDWTRCFSDNDDERERKSKEEIKLTLTKEEYQTDAKKNFFWRLMSREHQSVGYKDINGATKRRDHLAMLFLQVMMEDSYWKDFVVTTFSAKYSKDNITNINMRNKCKWDETNRLDLITTDLHDAARLEKVTTVTRLIKAKSDIVNNKYGYTPLHFAAMAIHPRMEIAKLLINSVSRKKDFLDKQTDEEWGRNAALHIAAANVNVTQKFIQQFKEANCRCRNSKMDTPFHSAAKSRNPNAIIYMLNTFAPTNNLWDVDDVDKDRDAEDILINICAREGNAKAVALLIKHGANISLGVLHEIVLESVRNPEKTDDLVQVYQSIVDNAVTWKCLEEEKENSREKRLIVKGSDEYAELFRKTMIHLLTEPPKDGKYEKDVLRCALAHGASAMFWQIINTKSVFRIQGRETMKFVDEENTSEVKKCKSIKSGKEVENLEVEKKQVEKKSCLKEWNWTVFDVTNFTKETSKDHSSSQSTSQLKDVADSSTDSESRLLSTETNRSLETEKPYLTYLLMVFDQWQGSNILSTQPLKELSKPYIKLVQRYYLILALLQLLFMVSFTWYFMPNACFLAQMFNITATGCSGSMRGNYNDNVILHASISQKRSRIAVLWLIWPIILLAWNVFITVSFGRQAARAHEERSKKTILRSKDLRLPSVLGKVLDVLLQTMALRIFCCLVFVWICVFFWGESHEPYVEVTALVLLFGWITNLEFFGAMGKRFSIFVLVVKEIVVKDMPSFMLFFGFTVVGFSFAMHTIRLSVCMHNEAFYFNETFFAVLSSAFGIGDFFEATVIDPTCAGGATTYLFEVVYLGYVWITMIILLNVLIAMMNNRYEKARRRAENIRRCRILSMMRVMESNVYKWLVNVVKKCRKLSLKPPIEETANCPCCDVVRRYNDTHLGSLYYNKKLKRYYLRLLLPVDKQLEKR